MLNLSRVIFAAALIAAAYPVTNATAGTPSTLVVPVMLFVAWRLVGGIR